MNKTYKLIISAFLVVFTLKLNHGLAQQDCLTEKQFSISAIGNEYDTLPVSMRIEILKDSLIIFPGESQNLYLLAFRILSTSCVQNEDSVLTFASFKLLLKEQREEKYPVMDLIFKNNKPHFFELVYPSSEKRRFFIRGE